MTRDEILRRVNIDIIERAAKVCAEQLAYAGTAVIGLSPDDATYYRFIVVDAGTPIFEDSIDGPHVKASKNYIVSLSFGLTYEWTGYPMDGSYCAQKWTTNDDEHTGWVVALFLTALAAHVPAVS